MTDGQTDGQQYNKFFTTMNSPAEKDFFEGIFSIFYI